MNEMILILIEGLVMCFLLLIVCVVGISNGPVGLVVLYEQDVQDRAVALGLTTKKKIKKSFIIASIAMFLPVFTFVPVMVYYINGAEGFLDGFLQMTAILLIQGLFDRFFIDWYWVGKTKAWVISGTEDLMPYIPAKVKIGKWLGTIVMFPALAALMAWIVTFFGK